MWLFWVDVELKQNEVTDDGIENATKILKKLGARRSNVQGAALGDMPHFIVLYDWLRSYDDVVL
jgi:hypothetical protein